MQFNVSKIWKNIKKGQLRFVNKGYEHASCWLSGYLMHVNFTFIYQFLSMDPENDL